MKRTLHYLAACLAATWMTTPGFAATDNYPSKTIRLIVAFPPGGPSDIVARIITPGMSKALGQTVVVENRGGAGGTVGAQAVASSEPDGYTLLLTTTSFAVNAALWGKDAGFDAAKDFAPVAAVATQPNIIVVHDSLPVKTLKDLQELSKTRKLAFATPGNGTTPQLTGEHLFKLLWKADITAIPYRGAGPAVAAVGAGEPPIASVALAGPLPFIKAGKLRPIAVSSKERVPSMPDVPTLYELGYPDILDYTWTAVLAPAGTPPDIVKKINAAIEHTLTLPEVKKSLDNQVMTAMGGTPAEFSDYLQTELTRWAKIVKDTGAKRE